MGEKRKVTIVGAGDVGATFAYALVREGIAETVVIADVNEDRARGQVLDLAHGLPFVPPVEIRTGTAADYADSDAIVVTAGARQRPGETRLELMRRNDAIVGEIMADIVREGSRGVVVMVTNPVDILTFRALEKTGWPRSRIMGSGTVLDSARFRFLLSRHCGVDARNVHAYILGEHGDSEFAAWSMVHLAGLPIASFCERCGRCSNARREREAIEEEVRKSAYHIIGYKGSTYFAIGLALVRLVGAILRDERSVLTVSVRLEGEFGLQGVCLGVPCVVGRRGIEQVIEPQLTESERTALLHSANVLANALHELADPTRRG